MLTPSEVIRRTRDCIESDDPEAARRTALGFLDILAESQPRDETLEDATKRLVEAYPAIGRAVLSRLTSRVVDGFAGPERVYHQTSATLALDIATVVPDAADECSELVEILDDTGLDEQELEQFFHEMSVSNPAFIANHLGSLVSDERWSVVRRGRAGAFVRGYHESPAPFEDAVESLRAAIDDSPDTRRTAAEQLGAIGLVVPEVAADTLPALLEHAESDEGLDRRVAIETVGLIVGTEPDGETRYGTPLAEVGAGLYGPLTAALDSTDPPLARSAVTALTQGALAGAIERERVVETLLDELAVPERPEPQSPAAGNVADHETQETVLEQLRTLAEREPLPPDAVSPLAFALKTATERGRRMALESLGRVAAPSERERIDTLLAEHIGDESDAARDGAIEGASAVLARREDPPEQLLDALLGAADADDESVRTDAYEALGATKGSSEVEAALVRGIERDRSEEATVAACTLERPAVVEAIVEELADAFDSGTVARDSAEGKSGSELSETQSDLLDCLNAVAEHWPAVLPRQTERLVALVTDPETPHPNQLCHALRVVAETDSESFRPFADRMETHLEICEDGAARGYLLAALLAGSDPDSGVVRHTVETTSARHLGRVVPYLDSYDPSLALRVLSALEVEGIEIYDHLVMGGWIHDIADMGTTDPRVHGPALDLCGDALTAEDDWTRWDGATALAHIAAAHPARVERFRDDLVEGLRDWNDHVPEWSLRALGRLGDPTLRSIIEPYTTHPRPRVREAARDAMDALADRQDVTDVTAERPTAKRAWRYVLGSSDSGTEFPANVPAEDRTEAVAVLLAGCQHPETTVSERARYALYELTDDNPIPDDASILPESVFGSEDPVVRALAARTAGRIPVEFVPEALETTSRHVASLLADDDPAVRRWAISSVGELGAEAPGAVEGHTDALAAGLENEPTPTRVTTAMAFRRLGAADSELLEPAIEPLAYCLNASDWKLRTEAATALSYASPSALGSVSAVPEFVCDRLDDDSYGRMHTRLGTVVGLLAKAEPSRLEPYADTLVEAQQFVGVRYAISVLAARNPRLFAEYDEELRADTNDDHTRRALADVRSKAYVWYFRSHVAAHPEQLPDELERYVNYLIAVSGEELRADALDALTVAVDSDPSVVEAALRRLVAELDSEERSRRHQAMSVLADALDVWPFPDDTEFLPQVVLPALADGVTDSAWEVRSQAFRATAALVESLPSPTVTLDVQPIIDAALEGLGDEQGWVRRHAGDVLVSLPSEVRSQYSVFARVWSAGQAGEPRLTRGATLALAKLAAEEGRFTSAFRTLAERADDDDRWVRQNALEGIALLAEAVHDAETAPLDAVLAQVETPVRERVRDALVADEPVLRAEACRCIAALGIEGEAETLAELEADPHARVREAATDALEAESESSDGE